MPLLLTLDSLGEEHIAPVWTSLSLHKGKGRGEHAGTLILAIYLTHAQITTDRVCTGPTSLILCTAQSKYYTLHKALRNEERKRSTNFQMRKKKEEKEKKSWMDYFSRFPPSTKPHSCSLSSMLSSYFRVKMSYFNLTDRLNYWLNWNSSHSCKLPS